MKALLVVLHGLAKANGFWQVVLFIQRNSGISILVDHTKKHWVQGLHQANSVWKQLDTHSFHFIFSQQIQKTWLVSTGNQKKSCSTGI